MPGASKCIFKGKLNSLAVPGTTIIFFFNDTATTEIYPLSLHDALPILATPPTLSIQKKCSKAQASVGDEEIVELDVDVSGNEADDLEIDHKSTSLNYSHAKTEYAAFCADLTFTAPHHLILH